MVTLPPWFRLERIPLVEPHIRVNPREFLHSKRVELGPDVIIDDKLMYFIATKCLETTSIALPGCTQLSTVRMSWAVHCPWLARAVRLTPSSLPRRCRISCVRCRCSCPTA